MDYSVVNLDCIRTLDENQKIAFLYAFVKMANVDGDFDDREKRFILDMALGLGVDANIDDDLCKNLNVEKVVEAVSCINNRTAALELIKILCLLSHTDGVISDSETLFIGDVAQSMNVDLDKVEQISEWVLQYILLKEQAKIVFEQI